jgi:DNA-directed RNA polymerase subunit RPC12/RpoP
MNDTIAPKPEVRGTGRVLYRCAECGEQMEPDAAVIVADKSYHPEHTPENDCGR